MDETTDPRRRLELEGARNVRDLGGYSTHDGGVTRWRRILRADSLHALSPAAQESLLGIGVRTVVDLRRNGEIEAEPNVFAASSEVDYHHLNMLGDGHLDIERPPEGTPTPQHMAHFYCGYLDTRQPAVSRILSTMAAAGNQAVLFHCAAGKDRTGVLAGLILRLAGVPVQTIAADYGLSAHFLAEPEEPWEEYKRTKCPPETMVLVFEHVERAYGGVEEYLRKIGVAEDHIIVLRERLVA